MQGQRLHCLVARPAGVLGHHPCRLPAAQPPAPRSPGRPPRGACRQPASPQDGGVFLVEGHQLQHLLPPLVLHHSARSRQARPRTPPFSHPAQHAEASSSTRCGAAWLNGGGQTAQPETTRQSAPPRMRATSHSARPPPQRAHLQARQSARLRHVGSAVEDCGHDAVEVVNHGEAVWKPGRGGREGGAGQRTGRGKGAGGGQWGGARDRQRQGAAGLGESLWQRRWLPCQPLLPARGPCPPPCSTHGQAPGPRRRPPRPPA